MKQQRIPLLSWHTGVIFGVYKIFTESAITLAKIEIRPPESLLFTFIIVSILAIATYFLSKKRLWAYFLMVTILFFFILLHLTYFGSLFYFNILTLDKLRDLPIMEIIFVFALITDYRKQIMGKLHQLHNQLISD
jgi:hypothetical protein